MKNFVLKRPVDFVSILSVESVDHDLFGSKLTRVNVAPLKSRIGGPEHTSGRFVVSPWEVCVCANLPHVVHD